MLRKHEGTREWLVDGVGIIELPDMVACWWNTGLENNLSPVLEVDAYKGPYTDFSNVILTLKAANTRSGTLKMSWMAKVLEPQS